MKVTSDDVIKSGEQELIDGITADLDWEAVENLFREQHHLPLGEDVAYRNGDLVVHENRIAYLLEFEVKVPLTLLLDREGNCIGIRAETPPGGESGEDAKPGAGSIAPTGENPATVRTPDEGEETLETAEGSAENRVGLRVSEALEELSGLDAPRGTGRERP